MSKFLFTAFLALLMSVSTFNVEASNPATTTSKTSATTQEENNKASVGGGILILLSLGVGYSARKLHEMRQTNRNLQE